MLPYALVNQQHQSVAIVKMGVPPCHNLLSFPFPVIVTADATGNGRPSVVRGRSACSHTLTMHQSLVRPLLHVSSCQPGTENIPTYSCRGIHYIQHCVGGAVVFGSAVNSVGRTHVGSSAEEHRHPQKTPGQSLLTSRDLLATIVPVVPNVPAHRPGAGSRSTDVSNGTSQRGMHSGST